MSTPTIERDDKPTDEPNQASQEEMDRLRASFTNDSAFMIAYERALEAEKENPLVVDPFAAKLAEGSKGKELSEQFAAGLASAAFDLWPAFHRQWTVVRTKFIDDQIQQVLQKPLSAGSKMQFVNLGAGLDTRCYRLDCMKAVPQAFEVDMEVINTPKQDLFRALGITKPLCSSHALVTADLKEAGQLRTQLVQAGYDPNQPAIFLAEGLLMYLGEQQLELVQQVSELAATGSTCILNFMEHPNTPPGASTSTEALRETLVAGGWVDLQFQKFGDDVLNYGRFDTKYKPSAAFSMVVGTKGGGGD